MGSDLNMEARNRPCPPPPPLSEQIKTLEDHLGILEERLGKVIAEKRRLEEQSRLDARTIVNLTRERDLARQASKL